MLLDVPYTLRTFSDNNKLWTALHDQANAGTYELLSVYRCDWAVTVTPDRPKTLQVLKLEQDVQPVAGITPVHGIRRYAYHAFASWPTIESLGVEGLDRLKAMPRNAANAGVNVHTHVADRDHVKCQLCLHGDTTPDQYAAFNRLKELLELLSVEKGLSRALRDECAKALTQSADTPNAQACILAMRGPLHRILEWARNGRGKKPRLDAEFQASIERALAMPF